MSGLESIIATGSDVLAGPLDFQIGNDQASYIASRESQTFFANQNVVTPTSVRTLKFQLGGNGFLDLSTLVFAFTLRETGGTHTLQPLTCEAHNFFRRMIVRISGTQVENKEFFFRARRNLRGAYCLLKKERIWQGCFWVFIRMGAMAMIWYATGWQQGHPKKFCLGP